MDWNGTKYSLERQMEYKWKGEELGMFDWNEGLNMTRGIKGFEINKSSEMFKWRKNVLL